MARENAKLKEKALWMVAAGSKALKEADQVPGVLTLGSINPHLQLNWRNTLQIFPLVF
jgi:hypothetical protein